MDEHSFLHLHQNTPTIVHCVFLFECIEKVINAFAPFPLPVKVAWSNAMNSLRQDRHQLTKKKKMKNQQKQQQ